MDKSKKENIKLSNFSFEEILEQNRKRIHFYIHRLGIHDPNGEFYSEGIYALWTAYKEYEPDRGPLATYFNYIIRNRLIDKIRKNAREIELKMAYVEKEKQRVNIQVSNIINNGSGDSNIAILQDEFWQEVKIKLTENQWNWVYYHIILDLPLKVIANKKNISIEAVKSWGKEARKKLRLFHENDNN